MVYLVIYPFYVFLDAFAILVPLLHIEKNEMIDLFKAFFLGFPPHTKGYTFLNLKYLRIEMSRHVTFYESHFPYILKNDTCEAPNNLSLIVPTNYDINCDISFDNAPTTHEDSTPVHDVPTTPPRQSSRQLRPPTYLEDVHTQFLNASTISTKYPIQFFLSCSALSPVFKRKLCL